MLWRSLQKLSLHFNTLHTRLALKFQATLRFVSASCSYFSFSTAKVFMGWAVRAAFLLNVIEFLVPLVESLLYLHLCLHQIIVLFCDRFEIILVLLILFYKGLVFLVQVFDQLFLAIKLLADLGYDAINHLRVLGASAVVFEQQKDKLDVLTRLDGWNCVGTLKFLGLSLLFLGIVDVLVGEPVLDSGCIHLLVLDHGNQLVSVYLLLLELLVHIHLVVFSILEWILVYHYDAIIYVPLAAYVFKIRAHLAETFKLLDCRGNFFRPNLSSFYCIHFFDWVVSRNQIWC